MLSLSRVNHIESYRSQVDQVVRQVARRDGSFAETSVLVPTGTDLGALPLDALHDAAWLRAPTAPEVADGDQVVRVVDLFAGVGGLTLGIKEACRALGLRMQPALAVDLDADALEAYGENFPDAELIAAPLESLLQPYGTPTRSLAEQDLVRLVGHVDVLIGGPPCQGHSDLNNHTRRRDPKNQLYALMARFCELVMPTHVVIENVPGVIKDRSQVAQRTWEYLEELGYSVDSSVMHAGRVGAAQQRRRSVTLASLAIAPSVDSAQAEAQVAPRSLRWAIGDLLVCAENAPFDTPPRASAENEARMRYLFEHKLFDLPDSQRPDCHRLKEHTYLAMYGRLRWDIPAPTITTGFGSMGRGRWVHPAEPRTITPHEAARVQGFPDFFKFSTTSRTLLHKVIGNAVPPKLGYAIGLHLLR